EWMFFIENKRPLAVEMHVSLAAENRNIIRTDEFSQRFRNTAVYIQINSAFPVKYRVTEKIGFCSADRQPFICFKVLFWKLRPEKFLNIMIIVEIILIFRILS